MRNEHIRFVLLSFLAVFAIAGAGCSIGGCSKDRERGDAEEIPSVAVTKWSDSMELFMEYPVPIAEMPGRFVIHLTVLDGFRPVRDGSVKLVFTGPAGGSREIEAVELLREGIFAPIVSLPEAGEYDFRLLYLGSGLRDTFHIDEFVVLPAAEAIRADSDGESAYAIGFLKEQQWKIPFATVEAEIRQMKRAIRAIGEVLPSPRAYAEIVAPVDGVLQVAGRNQLALPGSLVRRGDDLAVVSSPLQGDGWIASRLAYEQAKRNYERARRLKELDAVSQRELEEAESEFEARSAGFEGVEGSGSSALTLMAPISGRIIEWTARPGQLVRAGDKLMAVVDPSVVWLRVNVYESDFHSLGRIVGVRVHSDGAGEAVMLEAPGMRVLTTGGAIDPVTRTIPVLLEVANEDGRLTIHESTPVELYSSDGDSVLAVPETAVFEDGGFDVVFVQTAGESFEKRAVETGPRYAGWVSILKGLGPGDRVVSRGGYHVKLASISADIGHGHAH